jgi:hypothetical protein
MATRIPFRNILRIVVTVVIPAVIAPVCGGGDSTGVAGVCSVTSITVTPSTADASIGLPTTLTASVAETNCSTVRLITWQSSAPHIATVSDAGVVTGVAPGTATITATAGGKTSSSTVTVRVPVASVTMSSPGTSVVVGSTMQVSVQARDANGNVLSNRQFAWLSSNDAVATVSQLGIVTGLTAGSVTITATADGKSATLSVSVTGAATLGITGITPSSGSTDLTIESTVQITFSAALNAATVTAATVRVAAGATAVPGTLTVNGSTVTFTPTPVLTEFRTAYTVTVTTAVLSAVGNRLPNDATSTFTTAFWDPAYYYKVSNEYAGPTKALDTFSDTFGCFFATTGNFSGQFWYFTPTLTPGYYSMRNQFQGETKALEGADSPAPCFLTGTPPGGFFSGQLWKPVAFGGQFPTGYRLQNLYLGTAKSLDAPLVSGAQTPIMQATGNFTGQVWYFTRQSHR